MDEFVGLMDDLKRKQAQKKELDEIATMIWNSSRQFDID